MTQASRNEFAFADDGSAPAQSARTGLSVAQGNETPVVSPALELQRALDEMLNTAATPSIDIARGIVLTASMLAAAGVCSIFWWTTVSWAAGLLS